MEGVYVCDSRNNSIAAEHISFRELASRGASPMDMMAVTFCEENGIPGLIQTFLNSKYLHIFPNCCPLFFLFSPDGLYAVHSLQSVFSIFTSLEIYRGRYVEKGSGR